MHACLHQEKFIVAQLTGLSLLRGNYHEDNRSSFPLIVVSVMGFEVSPTRRQRVAMDDLDDIRLSSQTLAKFTMAVNYPTFTSIHTRLYTFLKLL